MEATMGDDERLLAVSDDDRGLELELEPEYDPLAADDADDEYEEDEDVEFIGLIERPLDKKLDVPPEPTRSPEECIADLLSSLPAQKAVLLGIIGYCREARGPADVDAFTLELQKTNRSVYTPVVLRKLLEDNGALVYVEAEDAPSDTDEAKREQAGTDNSDAIDSAAEAADSSSSDEPQYLVVTKRSEGTWVSTAAALGILDAIDPMSNLRALLSEEEEYTEIYLRILKYCAGAPRSKSELNDLVDDDPLLQKPRRYSGFFIDRLSESGALEWKPRWATTSVGMALLGELEQRKEAGDDD
jgi:hypothetical protein